MHDNHEISKYANQRVLTECNNSWKIKNLTIMGTTFCLLERTSEPQVVYPLIEIYDSTTVKCTSYPSFIIHDKNPWNIKSQLHFLWPDSIGLFKLKKPTHTIWWVHNAIFFGNCKCCQMLYLICGCFFTNTTIRAVCQHINSNISTKIKHKIQYQWNTKCKTGFHSQNYIIVSHQSYCGSDFQDTASVKSTGMVTH